MNSANVISIRKKGFGGQISAAVDSIIGTRREQQDFAGLIVEEEDRKSVV